MSKMNARIEFSIVDISLHETIKSTQQHRKMLI